MESIAETSVAAQALLNIDEQTFPDYSVVVVNDAGDPAAVDAVVAAAPPQMMYRSLAIGLCPRFQFVLHLLQRPGGKAAHRVA